MKFSQLNRSFIPVNRSEDTSEWGGVWGHKYGGWLDWPELLEKPRVVLLAEASSGKTEEFRSRVVMLKQAGKTGFFLRVEDLTDGPLTEGLDPNEDERFRAWLKTEEPGWFFLDSVDEARLNHKSVERALRRFAKDLGGGLNRAYVYLSCRVSDWKGRKDRELVERFLPLERRSAPTDVLSPEELLLKPILDAKNSKDKGDTSPSEEIAFVVRLAPLSGVQWKALAEAAGVENVVSFVSEIDRQGLEVFAERPGDLLELAEYWKAYGRFGSFREMTDFAITKKLGERDSDRTDNNLITEDCARYGAERLAAALTFGKSLTLRVAGQEADPTLAAGAIDPIDVLPDWTSAERNALLRRGIFAPATYGRIRFHHRSTQEYLTARWLDRLLAGNGARSEILSLLFSERYGVTTVVPSLRPVAAWLALDHNDIRSELLSREPLELLRYGDPRSLPLDAKRRLLHEYAAKEASGQVANDILDDRSFWMFAAPELASTIREIWQQYDDNSVRMRLLALIREGQLCDCVDLARDIAINCTDDEYSRHVAMRTLFACDDSVGLTTLSKSVMADPESVSARDAANIAAVVFPKYLTSRQLLTLIKDSAPARSHTTEGFAYEIDTLWDACPPGERAAFLEKLADMCLQPPFVADYQCPVKRMCTGPAVFTRLFGPSPNAREAHFGFDHWMAAVAGRWNRLT